jgi:hypothetical protein
MASAFFSIYNALYPFHVDIKFTFCIYLHEQSFFLDKAELAKQHAVVCLASRFLEFPIGVAKFVCFMPMIRKKVVYPAAVAGIRLFLRLSIHDAYMLHQPFFYSSHLVATVSILA